MELTVLYVLIGMVGSLLGVALGAVVVWRCLRPQAGGLFIVQKPKSQEPDLPQRAKTLRELEDELNTSFYVMGE